MLVARKQLFILYPSLKPQTIAVGHQPPNLWFVPGMIRQDFQKDLIHLDYRWA